MPGQCREFDSVQLEILWTRLISIVDEAAKAIKRTAFSTLSNEANDFACVLTDTRGRSLAQNSGSIPSFIATLPATVRHFINDIGIDNIRPKDIFITNDPWKGTGHLPDVCIVQPIFKDKRLIAFAATTSHVPDIGGRIRALEAREVYEEGLQIPLSKLAEQGEINDFLVRMIRANVRTPDQTMGDIWAQVGAGGLMAERLLSFMGDYGLNDLQPFAEELLGRCELAMHNAISKIPSGKYHYAMETDGMGIPFLFNVTLTINDGTITVDYAGTTPAQDLAMNCPMTYTYAMSVYALKCLLLPDLPNNDGMFRPIVVDAPNNSLVNPRYPLAVSARASVGHYLPIVIFGALSKAIPEKVMAGVGSPLWAITQTGHREDGSAYTNVMFFNGGMGAMHDKDGENCLSWPSNISSTPTEVAERNAPIIFREKALYSCSGGQGMHRGGLGQEVIMECINEKPIAMMFMAERTCKPAPGFFGGKDGSLGEVQINGESVNHRTQHILCKGDIVLLRTPGGGGYGEVSNRSKALSERDYLEGYRDDFDPS